jgi:hypothetical protein
MLYRIEQKYTSSPLNQSARAGLIGILILLGVLSGQGEPLSTGMATVEALTLDQSFTSPGDLGASINDCCRFVAQTFTAGLTGTLGGVNIDVQSSSTFPLHVAIRTVIDGVPGTTVLGETTLSSSGAPLSLLITFPQVINISAGVQYALVVNYEGAPPPSPDNFQGTWVGAGDDFYTGGAMYFSFLDGVSWFGLGFGDLHFQTYMNVTMEDTTPPVITISANPATLWPPNGKMVPVTVSGTIIDEPGGSGVDPGSAAYVVMDEYGRIQPRGSVPLVDGHYAFTVALEASRRGNDQDGRHYTIAVSAKDSAGNLGVGSTIVTVPHDQGN